MSHPCIEYAKILLVGKRPQIRIAKEYAIFEISVDWTALCKNDL